MVTFESTDLIFVVEQMLALWLGRSDEEDSEEGVIR